MERHQITIAREYRGMSQTELARKVVGLSQSNLSNYEKGLIDLSAEVKERIMSALGFPSTFLNEDSYNVLENANYRRKKSVKAEERRKIDGTVALIAYWFDWLSEMFELPDYQLGEFDLSEGYSAQEVARQIRRKCRLGNEPFTDICTTLESNGVFVFPWNCGFDKFDGVSLITSKGNPLIIINSKMSADRKRFTIAHELGHILLHECVDTFVPDCRDKEKEANTFASELLYPESLAFSQLTGLTLSKLPALKGYWKISMSAILEKARLLGCVNDSKYVQIRTEFSRRGWLKNEPYPVLIDDSGVVDKMVKIAKSELGYTDTTMRRTASLPDDFLIGEAKSNVLRVAFR